MNPVLLKPGSDRRTHVVVLGQPRGEVGAAEYRAHAPDLLQIALDSLDDLRAEYDVVICEGAGSPAEINLRDTDIANMGLARAAGLPVIVVGDIDRGGVFAALYGTLALLEPADQALISGFIINKFRGEPGAAGARAPNADRAHRPYTFGVLPWRGGLGWTRRTRWRSTGPRAAWVRAGPPVGTDVLRVGVVRPRGSATSPIWTRSPPSRACWSGSRPRPAS